jgi:hypothetical protein
MLGTLCPTDRCRCLCGEALGFDSLVGGDPSDRERSRADENYTFVTDRCGGGATAENYTFGGGCIDDGRWLGHMHMQHTALSHTTHDLAT